MSVTSLKDKVVLVTGAGSVVGAEIARHFSKLGASVVMTDGDRHLQIKVDKESGPSCLAISADLTKALDVINIISQTIGKYRKLDILVNCLEFPENPLAETESSLLQQFDRTMCSTVRAVYHVVLIAAPHLIKSKGNVVNIINSAGDECLANSVAKSSLETLMKSLALDLAPNQVRVNSITFDLPEGHETHNVPEVFPRKGNPNSNNTPGTDRLSKVDIDQTLGPGDIAESAAFLVSDASSFITGANIPVTGGRHLISTIHSTQKLKAATPQASPKADKSAQKSGGTPEDAVHNKSDSVAKKESVTDGNSVDKVIPNGSSRESSSKNNGQDGDHHRSKDEVAKHHGNEKQSHQNPIKEVNPNIREDNAGKQVTEKKGTKDAVEHKTMAKNDLVKNDHGKSAK